jgi:hypothetical protein
MRRPNKGESKTDWINAMMADNDVRQRWPQAEPRRQYLEAEYAASKSTEQPAPAPVTLKTFDPEPEPPTEEETAEDTDSDDDE